MFLLAQTTTTGTTGTEGTEANTYQIAFVNLAVQVFDIVLSTLLLIMQSVLTGFFSFLLPP
jgi:hypothetical protein